MEMNDQAAKPRMRAGGEALKLLAAPLNVQILRALEGGPKELIKLRAAMDSAPQSTARIYSRTLKERGLIDRRRRKQFPSRADYKITRAGRDLLKVAEVLEKWLELAPEGPIQLGSGRAKSTTKALVDGWSTNIVRAVAIRPTSLTEMSRLITAFSYPAIERRLTAMRLDQLVVPYPADQRTTPYIATNWLRRAVMPLTAAAGWEYSYPSDRAQPITPLDVEAAFLLAIPLLDLPAEFTGRCRLAVTLRGEESPGSAGVLVGFEGGRLRSCTSRLDGEADAWVSGPPDAWIRRATGVRGSLDVGGEIPMAQAVLDGLAAIAAPPPGDQTPPASGTG